MNTADNKVIEQNKLLRILLWDVLNSGVPLGWTELGKYSSANKNVTLREAIQDELNK